MNKTNISQKWISPLERIGYTAASNNLNMNIIMSISPDLQKHLQRLFESFCTGIRSVKSVNPKQYLKEKGLDFHKLNLGFCSGQFHHRKDDEWRQPFIELGVLTPSSAPVNDPSRKAYTCFGAYSVVFPLMDQQNKIVNLFAIRIKLEQEKEEYLNTFGLYPNYPSVLTRRLYVTSTVVEAASIVQSATLDSREAVIALHNGEWLEQHSQLIQELDQLEEIILIKN